MSGSNGVGSEIDGVLDDILDFFKECEHYVPVLGWVLGMLVDIPEGRELQMYDLADAYGRAAELYSNHAQDLSPYLTDLASTWQGDGAALTAAASLENYLKQAGQTADGLAGMQKLVQGTALGIESTKWMDIVNLVMLAQVVVEVIMTLIETFGLSSLGFMGAVAFCRTAIKEALEKLITQVAEQGFKGVLKDLAKAAGESLVKNAIKRGTEFAMFTIKTKLGITVLEAAEGHHPTFDPVEFAGEVADSFLTGALSAPFTFGKHGPVTEATSMAAGQFLDNLSKLPRNAIFNSMGLGQWAKDHGLSVSSDFSLADGIGTSTLFGAVMGSKGMREGARDAVADFKVDRGADALARAPEPAAATATSTVADPATAVDTAGALDSARAVDTAGAVDSAGGVDSARADGSSAGSRSDAPSSGTRSDGQRSVATDTGGAWGSDRAAATTDRAPMTVERAADRVGRAADPVEHATSVDHSAGPDQTVRADQPRRTETSTVEHQPVVERSGGDQHVIADPGSAPEHARDQAAVADTGATWATDAAARTVDAGPGTARDPGPGIGERTGTPSERVPTEPTEPTPPTDSRASDTRPTDARPTDSPPADARPADARPADTRPADSRPSDSRPSDSRTGQADRPSGDQRSSERTTREAPPDGSGPRDESGRDSSAPRDGAGDGAGAREKPRFWQWRERITMKVDAAYGRAVYRHFGSDGMEPVRLRPEMVDDVLRRPGDGLDRFGERLRQHIENHFTEVDAEGNRRSLDEQGIAAKLQELQRSGLPPAHDGELAGADHRGTEATPHGQGHDPSSVPRDQPTADPADADALSGADIRPRDDARAWYEWAPRAYDAFRADPTDVADIGGNLADTPRADGRVGFTEAEVAQVKQHLMVDEHPLDVQDGETVWGGFDADPDIAEAWLRLREGRPTDADLVLVEHELTESNFMAEHPDATYREAHDHANERFNWADLRPERTGEDLDASYGRRSTDGDPAGLPEDPGGRTGGRVHLRVPGDGSAAGHREGDPAGPTGGRDRGPELHRRPGKDHPELGSHEDLAGARDVRGLDPAAAHDAPADPLENPDRSERQWVAAARERGGVDSTVARERGRGLFGEVLDREFGRDNWDPSALATVDTVSAMVDRVLETPKNQISGSPEARRLRTFVESELTRPNETTHRPEPLDTEALRAKLNELYGADRAETADGTDRDTRHARPDGPAEPADPHRGVKSEQVVHEPTEDGPGLSRRIEVEQYRYRMSFDRFPVEDYPGGADSPQARAATHEAARALADAMHEREMDQFHRWLVEGVSPRDTEMPRLGGTAGAVMLRDGTVFASSSLREGASHAVDVEVPFGGEAGTGPAPEYPRGASFVEHWAVAEALDGIPESDRSVYHGRCAEPSLISDVVKRVEEPFRQSYLEGAGHEPGHELRPDQEAAYRDAFRDHLRDQLAGGNIASHHVGGPDHGREQFPCASDDRLIWRFGLHSDYVDRLSEQAYVDPRQGVVVLAPEGDPLRDHAAQLASAHPDWLVVAAHGDLISAPAATTPHDFSVPFGDESLSHVEVTRLVEHIVADHDLLQGRSRVVLVACDGAASFTPRGGVETSFADQLAARLHTEVVGASDTVWISDRGNIVVSSVSPSEIHLGENADLAVSEPDLAGATPDWRHVDPAGGSGRPVSIDDLVRPAEGAGTHGPDVQWARADASGPEDVPTEPRPAESWGLPEFPKTLPDDHPLLTPSDSINTPERVAWRNALVDEVIGDVQPADGKPQMYVMAGGGDPGKGVVLERLVETGVIPRDGVVHLDPDGIKPHIPEYRQIVAAGDSRAAAVVHEESSQISKAILSRILEGRLGFVYDATLGDPAKAVDLINRATAAGYEVHLYGASASADTAVVRNASLAADTGRYVPVDMQLRAHAGFSRGFEAYADLVHEAVLFDTNGPKPVVMAAKEPGGELRVVDADRYASFQHKADINADAAGPSDLYHEPAAALPHEGAPRLEFPTADPPRVEGMPDNPNASFRALHAECTNIAAEQLRLAESLQGDGKYWFAKVYHHVTMHELQMIDEGRYTYPIMKMQEVVAFHATYRANLDAWMGGRLPDVEPNWRAAFTAAEAAGSHWRPLPTLHVMDALLPSMQAHIRYDLPRAIADVYERYYAPRGVDFETFHRDFDRMQPVFDDASAALRPEIAARTFPGDPGQYELVQQHGFKFVFDVPRERLHAWEKAATIVTGHAKGVTDQPAMQRRLEEYSRFNHPFSGRRDFKIGGERIRDYDWNQQPEWQPHEITAARVPDGAARPGNGAAPPGDAVRPATGPGGRDGHGGYKLTEAENEQIFQDVLVPQELAGGTTQEHPVVVFVGGQTGAGKTAITKMITDLLGQRGGFTNINMDFYNPHHPDYSHLRAADESTASAKVRPDGEVWWDKAQRYAIEHRNDVVLETAMRNPAEYEDIARLFLDAGYRVETAIVAVPSALSRLGVLARYWGEVQEVGHGRLVEQEAHDACYEGVMRAAHALDTERLSHGVFVFRRGGEALYANQLAEHGNWTRPAGTAAALEAERTRVWTEPEYRRFAGSMGRLRDSIDPQWYPELDSIQALADPLTPAVPALGRAAVHEPLALPAPPEPRASLEPAPGPTSGGGDDGVGVGDGAGRVDPAGDDALGRAHRPPDSGTGSGVRESAGSVHRARHAAPGADGRAPNGGARPHDADVARDSGRMRPLVHDDNGLEGIDWADPSTFDLLSLQGATAEEIDAAVPGEWERIPSKVGDGIVYRDPQVDRAAAQTWLAQEVRDLLDVGSVGLYELVDMLTTSEFQLDVAEARSISKDLVGDLVAQGAVSIGLLSWPKDEVIEGPLRITVLDESGSWGKLPDNLYLALIPK